METCVTSESTKENMLILSKGLYKIAKNKGKSEKNFIKKCLNVKKEDWDKVVDNIFNKEN